MKWIAVLLVALLCGLTVAEVPSTLERFNAAFKQSVSISMSVDIPSSEVKRYLDALNLGQYKYMVDEYHRRGVEYKDKRDTIMSGSINVVGSGQFDMRNNLLLQTVNELYFDFNGFAKIELHNLQATTLIMYDLNKNYTWDAEVCTCTEISGPREMPLFYIPPYAKLEKTLTITINDEEVEVSEFSAGFEVGFNMPSIIPPSAFPFEQTQEESAKNTDDLISMMFYIYVDKSNIVRRVVFNVDVGIGAKVTVNTTTDFWDVKPLEDNELIVPDTKCQNVCKAEVDIVKEYNPCVTPSGNCICPSPSDIPFCNDVVNYPVCKTLFLAETDLFINTTYFSMAATLKAHGELDQSCLDELRAFYCKFYLPYCSSDGAYLKPDLNTSLSCFVNVNGFGAKANGANKEQTDALMNTATFSSYETAAGKTKSYENKSSSGLEPWKIGLIVAGAVVFVALVVVIVVVVVRRRRAQYQAL